jgi:hypothetical protein
MAISEKVTFRTIGLTLPKPRFWRFGMPDWHSDVVAPINREITSLADHFRELFPVDERIQSNLTSNLNNPATAALLISTFKDPDIKNFYNTHQTGFTKHSKTEHIVNKLAEKLEEYKGIKEALDTRQTSLTQDLEKLSKKNRFVRWLYSDTKKNIEQELQQVTREQIKLNRNYLSVAGVSTKYINENYARLTQEQSDKLNTGIKPLLAVIFDKNTHPGATATLDFILLLTSKLDTPEKRIQLACEQTSRGLENNNPHLRENARLIFNKELATLEAAINTTSPAVEQSFNHIKNMVNNKCSLLDESHTSSLRYIRMFLTQAIKDSEIQSTSYITAKDIFNYVRACYGLPSDSISAAETFFVKFKKIIEDPNTNADNVRGIYLEYDLIIKSILPFIVDGYNKNQDNVSLIDKIKQEMKQYQNLALNGSFMGTKTGHDFFNRVQKCHALLDCLGDASHQQEYANFNREYYRNMMRNVYELKVKNMHSVQVEAIVNELFNGFNGFNESFQSLPEEDQENIKLLLILKDLQADLPGVLKDEQDGKTVQQQIDGLNSYLAENPRTLENYALGLNDSLANTAGSASNSSDFLATPISRSKGKNKSTDNGKRKENKKTSSDAKTTYDCSKWVIDRCKSKLDQELSQEIKQSYIKLLSKFDPEMAAQYSSKIEEPTEPAYASKYIPRSESRWRSGSDESITSSTSSNASNSSPEVSIRSSSSEGSDANTSSSSSLSSMFKRFFWNNETEESERLIETTIGNIEKNIPSFEAHIRTRNENKNLNDFYENFTRLDNLLKSHKNINEKLLERVEKIKISILTWVDYCHVLSLYPSVKVAADIKTGILELPLFNDFSIMEAILAVDSTLKERPAFKELEGKRVAQLEQQKNYLNDIAEQIQKADPLLDGFISTILHGTLNSNETHRHELIINMNALISQMHFYETRCEQKNPPSWFTEKAVRLEGFKTVLAEKANENADGAPTLQRFINLIGDFKCTKAAADLPVKLPQFHMGQN